MRDEDEIQELADKANDYANGKRLNVDGSDVSGLFAAGVATALDWVLDEDMEESPL